jgi:hypothetical protein
VAAVRIDDGSADCETQAGATGIDVVAAALKLRK